MSSTDETMEPGDNAKAAIKRFADRMSAALDAKADADADIKQIKEEMKAAAFGKDEMKAFNQCVKEQRRGPDFQADQQQLEAILDTYRRALGLPTDLETAQQLAAEATEKLPEPRVGAAPDDEEEPDAYGDLGGKPRRKGGLN